MIESFANKDTENIFHGERSRRFDQIKAVAFRKLAMLHSAHSLSDLKSPGTSLEALTDDRAGQHAIRINDKYRVCFVWKDAGAHRVQITDYH